MGTVSLIRLEQHKKQKHFFVFGFWVFSFLHLLQEEKKIHPGQL
jgi:hypothetical protein